MSWNDELELVAIRSVLVDGDGPSAATQAAARIALLETTDRRARAARPLDGRRRRVLPALGLAGALAAAGLFISQVLVGGGAVQPQSAAAAVLERAADAALASPPARLGPGQYWYAENQGTYLDGAVTRHGELGVFVSNVSKVWIGAERYFGRDHVVRLRPAQPITQAWQRQVLRGFRFAPSFNGGGGSYDVPVSYRRMLAMPTGTAALTSAVFRAEVAPGFTPKPRYRAQIMFTSIHDILIEPMVPAKLQAGLYRVAARIPGVRLLGLTHDTLRRAALAVGFVDHSSGYEDELLFDPVSYALLDYRETARRRAGPYLPAGTVVEETAFIRAGLVHRVGQVPSAARSRRRAR